MMFARALVLFGMLGLMMSASAQVKNGFDLSNSVIPVDEIHHGGPPRDGIPSIDDPIFVTAERAEFLRPGDRVLGLYCNGIAKAYPIRILNWHEVVNDRFGSEAVAVTYCPLCGTGMSFKAEVAGEVRDFGVSGLLYNSDVLLYDRPSESLFSQISTEAISGPLVGTRLEMVPTAHTDSRYHPKEWVIGIELNGDTRAYPFSELERVATPLDDKLAGREVTVEFDAEHRTGRILDAGGEEIPSVMVFWFAWAAFHPDTGVFSAGSVQ